MGGELGDFNGLDWSCGLWLWWVDSGDLGRGYGLRQDHGSRLRLGFDLDWGSRLNFDGLISMRGEPRWLCCVCGCGWEVEEEGWWWLDCGCFFFWLQLVVVSWEVTKEEGCWGPGLCFFFPSSCYCSLWLWMVGQQWKWLLLLCYDDCCDGLVFFFFVSLFCWDFWIWNLLVLLVLLISVDVVAVVDDNGEEMIYYFNV